MAKGLAMARVSSGVAEAAFLWCVVLASAAGCSEPRCPGGYTQMGDRCYRIKDAGTVDASDAEDTDGGTDQGDPDGDDGAVEDQDGEAGDAAEASENDA